MGTKLPANIAASDQQGDAMMIEGVLEEKYSWQEERGLQFNPTLDVLRFTEAGGNPAAHIPPTRTQVAGLSGLSCTVEDFTESFVYRFGSMAEAGDKKFVLYDTEIDKQDRIEYGDKIYRPKEVFFEAESGRCEFLAGIEAE